MPRFTRFAPVVASFALLPSVLTGCSANNSSASSAAPLPAVATGNWQISSSEAAAANLPAVSGSLTGTSAALTGTLHSQSAKACIAPSTPFAVTGAASAKGMVTLSGPLAGGTITVTGSLAPDGRSLTGATYNVAGGSCGFAKAADATARVYMPISGAYTGTFRDSDGQIATVQATLNQSPDANGDGNYTLSGSATPNNACFSATVPLSNTTVTGGNFTFTYTDPNTTNSVTALGTFSTDASTLTVTNWTSSGPCGADSGTGIMTRQ